MVRGIHGAEHSIMSKRTKAQIQADSQAAAERKFMSKQQKIYTSRNHEKLELAAIKRRLRKAGKLA
jgi:hypothetical protein